MTMPPDGKNGGKQTPSNPLSRLGRDRVGRYEIIYPIAMGGMAGVYAGRLLGQGGFEKLVAIKIVHPHLTSERAFVEMFLDEARLAARLQHPNIGEVYEIGQEDELLYMVGELIMGQDLSALFRRIWSRVGAIEPAYAALIAKEVCAGLQEAHDLRDDAGRPLNIVHRDVTPRNVLVSYRGQVKLIDFGVAFARYRLTSTAVGLTKGKIGFMPPEQIRGPTVDRRSDIFSLGVSLYWMVTGEHPFSGNTDALRIQRILSGKVKPPRLWRPDLSPALEKVILKALASRPVERFETAAQMGEALTPLVPGGFGGGGTESLGDLVSELFEQEHDEQLQRIRRHRDRGNAPKESAENRDDGSPGASIDVHFDPEEDGHGKSSIPAALETGSVRVEKERYRLVLSALLMAAVFGFVVVILGLVFTSRDGGEESRLVNYRDTDLNELNFSTDEVFSAAQEEPTDSNEERAGEVADESAGRSADAPKKSAARWPEKVAAHGSEEVAAKGLEEMRPGEPKEAKAPDTVESPLESVGPDSKEAPAQEPEDVPMDDPLTGETIVIDLSISVPDARVSIDGEVLAPGVSSFEVPADGKKHVLDISAKGYKKKSVHFEADIDKKISVSLQEIEKSERPPSQAAKPGRRYKRSEAQNKKADEAEEKDVEPKLKTNPY